MSVEVRVVEGAGHFSFMHVLPPQIVDPLSTREPEVAQNTLAAPGAYWMLADVLGRLKDYVYRWLSKKSPHLCGPFYFHLVEAGGIEPPSASPRLQDLRA